MGENMTTLSIRTLVPTPVRRPRGSEWAAQIALKIGGAAQRLWSLRKPKPMTRGQEAEAVRTLARSLVASDPGFAADLYAAAARHDSALD
jgi:hypothetical protein